MNLQIFLSTLRTAMNTEGNVAGAGSGSGAMRQSIDTMHAAFGDLQEVLDRPVLQYAVLNSFLVKALGRQPLASRLVQSRKVILEVCT
jgi:hypothetical protein